MLKSTQEQFRFHPSNGKTIRADFDGGELLSDFGVLLLRETILQSSLMSRMAEAFVHHFIGSYKLPPAVIIIDLDHTPAITHGGQQMNLFNAKYQHYCYLHAVGKDWIPG